MPLRRNISDFDGNFYLCELTETLINSCDSDSWSELLLPSFGFAGFEAEI